jgi:hypothetical protein
MRQCKRSFEGNSLLTQSQHCWGIRCIQRQCCHVCCICCHIVLQDDASTAPVRNSSPVKWQRTTVQASLKPIRLSAFVVLLGCPCVLYNPKQPGPAAWGLHLHLLHCGLLMQHKFLDNQPSHAETISH